ELPAHHLEAELLQLVLRLVEGPAAQVGDRDLGRPVRDIDGDRLPRRDGRARRGGLPHDDALRLAAVYLYRVELDVVRARPALDGVDVLAGEVRQRHPRHDVQVDDAVGRARGARGGRRARGTA